MKVTKTKLGPKEGLDILYIVHFNLDGKDLVKRISLLSS